MAQGVKRDKVLAICGVSKNQYYYSAKGGSRGRKRSKTTIRESAGTVEVVSNKDVAAHIGSKYEDPQVDYGYHKMTAELQLDGFKINHKKVYRLMKAGNRHSQNNLERFCVKVSSYMTGVMFSYTHSCGIIPSAPKLT
ncbi:MAG: IS3 family transposase, partial [Saprospiraceae bacterium]